MGKIIQVGMAELKFAQPPDTLMTAGLGSCIGICIRDEATKNTCMCHIMLPSSEETKHPGNQAKYADTAIIAALAGLKARGANPTRLVAKIAGGAQMFRFIGENDVLKIGERNALAVERNLEEYKIRLLTKDIGGNYGRTITFDPATGALHIRTIRQGEKII